MQGETVYLTRSASPRSSSPSQNGHRHTLITAPPQSFVYQLEALRLQAVGDFEQAILILLRQYHQTFQNIRASNPEEAETLALGTESQLAMLVNEISALFLELIEEQYKNTFYEKFYNLLQDENTHHFFEAHLDIQKRLTNILLQSSYRLAQAKRYQNAHDFAALALQIEPKNEQAKTLEALCQQYLNLLSSEDEEERLELACYIAETDPDFGNIAEDVKRLDSAARGSAGESQPLRATSRPAPGTAYVPSHEPYTREIESPVTTPAQKLIQPGLCLAYVNIWGADIAGSNFLDCDHLIMSKLENSINRKLSVVVLVQVTAICLAIAAQLDLSPNRRDSNPNYLVLGLGLGLGLVVGWFTRRLLVRQLERFHFA